MDLNGFTLAGQTGCLARILVVGARENIILHNGVISDWPGGWVGAADARYATFHNLRTHSCWAFGIRAGDGCPIYDCSASTNGNGIAVGSNVLIADCVSENNDTNGMQVGNGALIVGSEVCDNRSDGIRGSDACWVGNCRVNGNADDGMDVGQASLVTGCTAYENGGDGIVSTSYSFLLNNQSSGNGSASIHVTSYNSRIEGNQTANNRYGIRADGYDNWIIKNTALENSSSGLLLGGTQVVGPSMTSSGTITTNNPWTNVQY